jgi:hypothetical protein
VILFIAAALILLLCSGSPAAVLLATGLWGVTFGGASAQLQSALSRSGRENSDVANSFLPVAFNLAIFAAGILGAVLLERFDALILAGVMAALGAVTLLVTVYGRRSAYTGSAYTGSAGTGTHRTARAAEEPAGVPGDLREREGQLGCLRGLTFFPELFAVRTEIGRR